MRTIILSALMVSAITACSPEIGSERWCEKLEATPKGDWTANDAGEYAKSCVLGIRD